MSMGRAGHTRRRTIIMGMYRFRHDALRELSWILQQSRIGRFQESNLVIDSWFS